MDKEQSVTPKTFKEAVMTMNPKIVLAFFLIIVAAMLLVFFTNVLVDGTGKDGKPPLDAGTIALIASMVTTFILMAKSAADYQFSSSAGSDKKDDTQARVASSLAEKVSPQPPVAPAPAPTAWWAKLGEAEKTAISADADARVKAIVLAMTSGSATPDDLAYLVSKGLLTQVRADEIKA